MHCGGVAGESGAEQASSFPISLQLPNTFLSYAHFFLQHFGKASITSPVLLSRLRIIPRIDFSKLPLPSITHRVYIPLLRSPSLRLGWDIYVFFHTYVGMSLRVHQGGNAM
eukprot:scpid102465/ scgid13801/ 